MRPAGQATTLLIEVERPGQHFKALTEVSTNARGYWTLNSGVHALRWRVRWKSPQGKTYEGPAVQAY